MGEPARLLRRWSLPALAAGVALAAACAPPSAVASGLEPTAGPRVDVGAIWPHQTIVDWVEHHEGLDAMLAASDTVVVARVVAADAPADTYARELEVRTTLAGEQHDAGDRVTVGDALVGFDLGAQLFAEDTWYLLFLDQADDLDGADAPDYRIVAGPLAAYVSADRTGRTFDAVDPDAQPRELTVAEVVLAAHEE